MSFPSYARFFVGVMHVIVSRNIAIKYGNDSSHAQSLIREAKVILTHISHPNCIKIFGFYDCPKKGMGVAMELMDCNLAYCE
ncbi:hypothetical protein COOONC_17572 [Cooperia oncophora]